MIERHRNPWAPRSDLRRTLALVTTLWVTTGCGTAALFPDPAAQADAASGDSVARLMDTGTPDTGTPDTGTPDTGIADTGAPDTAIADTGAPDTGIADTGAPDTGIADTGIADTGMPDTGPPDTGPTDSATTDSGPSLPCSCTPKQVLRNGACVATTALGCAAPCQATSCPANQVCDAKAAVVSCTDATPAPACVAQQAMGFPLGALRVTPVALKTGAKTTLTVVGGNFYIGALWWVVGVGPDVIDPADEYSAPCTLKGDWAGKTPGVYAVRVGYGGLQPDLSKGGLAGFVRVSDGGGLSPGVQPGYPCSAKTACAQGDGWSCGCDAAQRCACNKSP